MMEAIDQVFVTAKHFVVGLLPEQMRALASIFLSIAPIFAVFGGLFALTTVIERKSLGRIQNRIGPNRVGPFGFLQFAADGIKAIIKEDVVPRAADKLIHFLAPICLVVPALLTYAVLPIGRNMAALNLDAGLLFFFAVGAGTEIAVFMAGWSSRNKYSLLGAMRAVAQMISYEIPLVLSTVPVIMAAGTLSLVGIIEAQLGDTGGLTNWNIWTPWGMAGFLVFFISALAEANRAPFDLPEAESEIIAGYFVEYSGFKFALFFLGEYLGMFSMGGLGIALYLGGWSAPFSWLAWIPSWACFFIKLAIYVAVIIWIRGTVPRLRADQLMGFAWKFLLPLALVNVVAAGLWRFLPGGLTRWLVCSVLLVGAYFILGRALNTNGSFGRRTYRYAS